MAVGAVPVPAYSRQGRNLNSDLAACALSHSLASQIDVTVLKVGPSRVTASVRCPPRQWSVEFSTSTLRKHNKSLVSIHYCLCGTIIYSP